MIIRKSKLIFIVQNIKKYYLLPLIQKNML